MQEFLHNQEILTNVFKALTFFFCLFFVLILGFYNWLYLSRILKSKDQVGLRPPGYIAHLIKTCIYIPIGTAVFIVIFIIVMLIE